MMRINKKVMLSAGLVLALQSASFANSVIVVPGSNGASGSTNGIAFKQGDTSGTELYVTSTNDAKIYSVNTTTGALIKSLGFQNGIITPDDLVVAADGTIYYTDTIGPLFTPPATFSVGFVGKIDPSAPVPMVTPLPQPPSPFSLLLVNSIALADTLNPDGSQHLYASQCFLQAPPETGLPNPPNFIYDFNLTTGAQPLPIGFPTPITFGFGCALNGMAYKDGYIYGPQTISGDIYRVGPLNSTTQAPTKQLVLAGQSSLSQCPGQNKFVVNPSAVKFDASGKLYVADSFSNEIWVIDNPTQVCSSGSGQNPKKIVKSLGGADLDNIAVNPANNNQIFVSSLADGYLVPISVEDQQVGTPIKSSGLVQPTGIAAIGNHTLFVADSAAFRTVNTQSGTVKSDYETIQGFLDRTGVSSSYGVAPFGDDKVVIASWLDQLVQVYDTKNNVAVDNMFTAKYNLSTNQLLNYGRPMSALGYKSNPNDSMVVVSAFDNNPPLTTFHVSRLIKFSGTHLQTATVLGASLPGAGAQVGMGFTGTATDGTRYWVADSVSGSIFQFNDNGIITPAVITGLSNPRGIAYYNNRIYVMEKGTSSLVYFDITNPNPVKVTVESGLDMSTTNPPFAGRFVASVTIDPDNGTVYYSLPGVRDVKKVVQ